MTAVMVCLNAATRVFGVGVKGVEMSTDVAHRPEILPLCEHSRAIPCVVLFPTWVMAAPVVRTVFSVEVGPPSVSLVIGGFSLSPDGFTHEAMMSAQIVYFCC